MEKNLNRQLQQNSRKEYKKICEYEIKHRDELQPLALKLAYYRMKCNGYYSFVVYKEAIDDYNRGRIRPWEAEYLNK